MPVAAPLAAALQGTFSPPYGLYLNGANVLLESGTGLNRYGVPLETIEVTESGPPGVSSMKFTLEDPGLVHSIAAGDEVFYTNNTTGVPEFRGWVQRWNIRVLGIGRAFDVECVGVEAILDWLVIPALTITAGTYAIGGSQMLVQQMVAAAVGSPHSLRVIGSSADQAGSLEFPVGGSATYVLEQDIVLAGATLREALRNLGDYRAPSGSTGTWRLATVDYFWGLRWVQIDDSFPNRVPADYVNLTVVDTVAGPIRAAGLDHEVDAGSQTRSVYVKGGNAAGTGLVTDGTNKPGPSAYIEDATILTAVARDAAGIAYLRDKSYSVRGDFAQETFIDTYTPAAHLQVMSNVVITDAQVGLAATTYRIAQIRKRYHGGRLETWEISYGGMPASFPNEVRRLTRTVRS